MTEQPQQGASNTQVDNKQVNQRKREPTTLYPLHNEVSRRTFLNLGLGTISLGLLVAIARGLGISLAPRGKTQVPELTPALEVANNHEIEVAFEALKQASLEDNTKALVLLGVGLAAKIESAPIPEDWAILAFSMGGSNGELEEKRYGYAGYLNFDRTQGLDLMREWHTDTGQYVQYE